MSLPHTIWLVFSGLVFTVWALRLILMGAVLRSRLILTESSHDDADAAGRPCPKISVIVAAKDEEDNIATCIRSLMAQDYPNFELIAVDDRSGDRTPQILRELAGNGAHPLQVVTIRELRAGWFGKNNAMREGVAASAGEWFLFTDADCRFVSSRAISTAVRDAITHDCDFLSITPVLETRAWWERVIQPVCAMVLIFWFLPSRVNNPAKKTAYANGAFMLMKRSCYDAIGGHERVRTEVNEDILMAVFAKSQGLRLRVVENEGLYETRMYTTPRDAWRGWSRIFYGSLRSIGRVGLAAGFLLTFSLSPWISFVISLIGGVRSDWSGAWPLTVMCWSVVLLTMHAVIWKVYRVLHFAGPWSFSYPVGCVTVFCMLLNAMLKTLGAGSTTWRGTTYRGDQTISDTDKTVGPVDTHGGGVATASLSSLSSEPRALARAMSPDTTPRPDSSNQQTTAGNAVVGDEPS